MVSSNALRSFFIINRSLLPIKLHYGLYNAGTSTVQPIMPVYGKVLHFSSFVVGTIYSIVPLLGLIIKPSFCALADKMKWHRGVLIFWEIILVAAYFSVQFIPPAERLKISPSQVENISLCSFGDSTPYFLIENEGCRWNCSATADRCSAWNMKDSCLSYKSPSVEHIDCISLPPVAFPNWKNDCQVSCPFGKEPRDDTSFEQEDSVTFQQWQFWVFLFLIIGAWNGNAIITTMSDTICIEICGAKLYGQQRVWGCFAWGIFASISGYLVDTLSKEGEEKDYTPAFYMFLVPVIIDIILFFFIKFEIPQKSQNIAVDVWKVCLVPRNAITMIWCSMVGISFGLIWNFLYWYIEELADDLEDASVTANLKTIEGLILGVHTVLGEAPAFFFGSWIVAKLGHAHSLSTVFLLLGLRFTLYSILVNPWWCLPIEILQCTSGMFYSTITSYAKSVAAPGTEATIQALLATFAEGVGVAVGSFIGGIFFQRYGGGTTMQIFGIVFFIVAVLSEVVEFILKAIEGRHKGNLKISHAL